MSQQPGVIELPVLSVEGYAGGNPIPFAVSEASEPHGAAVDMPVAGTEYTQVLPAGTRKFMVRPRKSIITLRYGTSPINTVTIGAGSNLEVAGINLQASLTLKMIGKVADEKTEIEWWV